MPIWTKSSPTPGTGISSDIRSLGGVRDGREVEEIGRKRPIHGFDLPLGDWNSPSAELLLLPGAVHLWRIDADLEDRPLQICRQLLSPQEQQRADRLRFAVHQRRFIASRGALRRILGQYLNCPPDQLAFDYGDQGKPVLVPGINPLDLQFNLSHSEALTLVAIAPQHPVGVDLECRRSMNNLSALTRRFFSPAEFDAIQGCPAAEQELLFFRYWTAKEALLKAMGQGLSQLQTVEVELGDTTATPIRLAGMKHPAAAWTVRLLMPAAGYTAAIATPSSLSILKFWQWIPPGSKIAPD